MRRLLGRKNQVIFLEYDKSLLLTSYIHDSSIKVYILGKESGGRQGNLQIVALLVHIQIGGTTFFFEGKSCQVGCWPLYF